MGDGVNFKPDYSRQQQLSGFGKAGQEKLNNAKVLVIGAGGLGCAVIPVLAGAGVGQLEIVDHDTVDASNLHRQTIYRADQVGQYKADLAAAYALSLNPTIIVSAHTQKLTAPQLLEKIAEADLILECTDDFNHKMRVNDAVVLLQKPAVFANAVKLEGQLQSFSGNSESPCLRCLWQQVPGSAMTCEAHGVLGSVPALLGNLQANEALHLLTGVGEGLQQRVMYFDAANYCQRLIRLQQSIDCPLHTSKYQRKDFLLEHNAIEFSGSFEEAISEGMTVLDIRDKSACLSQPLPVACRTVSSADLLAEHGVGLQQDLLGNKRVLLVCYKGRTSLSIASVLRNQGYVNVYSKVGGAG